MQLLIKSIYGHEIVINNVNSTDTIKTLKMKIYEQEYVPIERQKTNIYWSFFR